MTDNDDFTVEFSEEPQELSREDYLNAIETIAENAYHEYLAEMHDSLDDSIESAIENHLYVMDKNRALQVISVSDCQPIPPAFEPHKDKWREVISHMAKECMTDDIRQEIMEKQQDYEENLGI